MVVKIWILFLWVMTPHSLLSDYHRFGGTNRLHSYFYPEDEDDGFLCLQGRNEYLGSKFLRYVGNHL
jgi:hypothetical protein